MKKIIGISDQDLTGIIDSILKFFPKTKIYAFGSRVTGNPPPRKYSDLDISLDNRSKLDSKTMNQLQEFFEESDFPLMIDISDYHRCDEEFKKIIDSSSLELTGDKK